ncbi:hypothetical protein [Erwinia persicina]|uniref:hypothetical protein n=1 Tax=Erwinia persicina TaxID=55211 RepID=UPI003144E0E9
MIEEGILIKRSKMSVAQIKGWSPRLEAMIKAASVLPLKIGMGSLYVIHPPSGSKYTRDGFNSRWMKAKQASKVAYPDMDFDFTFHALKAKGISDLSGSLYEIRRFPLIKMLSKLRDMTER